MAQLDDAGRVREALLILETCAADPSKLAQLTGLPVRQVAVACARLAERGFVDIERSAYSLPFAKVSLTPGGSTRQVKVL